MEIIESIESENPLQFLKERGNQRLSNPLHCCEILALNQRTTGSPPVRPTNTINDLGRSRQDSLFHKICYRSVSGNCAAAFPGVSSAGLGLE